MNLSRYRTSSLRYWYLSCITDYVFAIKRVHDVVKRCRYFLHSVYFHLVIAFAVETIGTKNAKPSVQYPPMCWALVSFAGESDVIWEKVVVMER